MDQSGSFADSYKRHRGTAADVTVVEQCQHAVLVISIAAVGGLFFGGSINVGFQIIAVCHRNARYRQHGSRAFIRFLGRNANIIGVNALRVVRVCFIVYNVGHVKIVLVCTK